MAWLWRNWQSRLGVTILCAVIMIVTADALWKLLRG